MRLLLDTCVWGGVVTELQTAGHEVDWVGGWSQDPGDKEILSYAYRHRLVLVTLDKDFGELAVVHGQAHSGIIRLVGLPARQQGTVCAQLVDRFGDELLAGAIITADGQRVRIRPADSE